MEESRILPLPARHGARNVRVFSSVALGDARPDSDVDLLVGMEVGKTYFDLVNLWMEAQEPLRRKVDVLTEPEVSPYMRKRALQEVVAL